MTKAPLDSNQIQSIEAICREVGKKNQTNPITLRMCEGIPDFARRCGYLSQKQWDWIKTNAKFHQIPLPKSLTQVEVSEAKTIENDTDGPAPSETMSDHDFRRGLIGSLARIEKRLAKLGFNCPAD